MGVYGIQIIFGLNGHPPFHWVAPFFSGTYLGLIAAVGASKLIIYGLGYITKLLLIPENCDVTEYYRPKVVAEEMVKKNRREELKVAWEYMTPFMQNLGSNKSSKKERKNTDDRKKRMEQHFRQEMNLLKEKEIDPKERTLNYEKNKDRKEKLMQNVTLAYSKEQGETFTTRKFKKGEVKVRFCDKSTGVVLVSGNFLDAGSTEEGRESIQAAVREATKVVKKGKETEEEVMKEMDDIDASISAVLNTEHGEEEMWVASTHVDLRRRKKKTVKSICDSIAAEGKLYPYVPKTGEQNNALRELYTSEKWGEVYWKACDSMQEIMEQVIELRKLFPSSVSPMIRKLIVSDACKTTINRAINLMEGKGLSVSQEVNAIGRVSELLLITVKSR